MSWGGEPGSKCTLRIDWSGGDPAVEGDILRTDPAGSCYLIEAARESRATAGRWIFDCVRLGVDAAPADGDGVFLFYWHRRSRG